MKNFHNAGPKKTKESDKFSAEKIRESEKIVIANETLMSGIKNLIGSSKSEYVKIVTVDDCQIKSFALNFQTDPALTLVAMCYQSLFSHSRLKSF